MTTTQYAEFVIARRQQRVDDKVFRSSSPKMANKQNTYGWLPRKVQAPFVDPVTRWDREAAFVHPILPKDRLANLAKWDTTHPFFTKYPQPFLPTTRKVDFAIPTKGLPPHLWPVTKIRIPTPPSVKTSRASRRLLKHLYTTMMHELAKAV